MLDRWSVLSIEGPQATAITQFEDIIAKKLGAVMKADDPRDVLRAVKSLCKTIHGPMKRVAITYTKIEQWEREVGRHSSDLLTEKCISVDTDETKMEESGVAFEDDERKLLVFISITHRAENLIGRHIRESLVRRANSLKKALKDIMSVAERGISKHNCISEATTKCDRFRRKRSKSTMSALKASSSNLSSSSKCFPPVNPIRRNRFDHFSVKASDTQVSQTTYLLVMLRCWIKSFDFKFLGLKSSWK
ncbi:hypothetical protein DICVIV_09963 [Dictyocaulus viviparus]|uniref:Uncharacterized protein n=1 Tax=Dictyocaulus viviparus TaxID=29172 RepID=A0A0D8XJT9_DICVI|nr:hypothetical protein DICVIV_09963 [Dictyocaulus viviparus]